MKTLHTYKAEAIRPDNPIEPLTIIADRDVPRFRGEHSLYEARAAYATEAYSIVKAMLQHMPGGLVDAILVALMKEKVSVFVVPYEQPEIETTEAPQC